MRLKDLLRGRASLCVWSLRLFEGLQDADSRLMFLLLLMLVSSWAEMGVFFVLTLISGGILKMAETVLKNNTGMRIKIKTDSLIMFAETFLRYRRIHDLNTYILFLSLSCCLYKCCFVNYDYLIQLRMSFFSGRCQFDKLTCLDRAMVNFSAGAFLVMVDPAAMVANAPI